MDRDVDTLPDHMRKSDRNFCGNRAHAKKNPGFSPGLERSSWQPLAGPSSARPSACSTGARSAGARSAGGSASPTSTGARGSTSGARGSSSGTRQSRRADASRHPTGRGYGTAPSG